MIGMSDLKYLLIFLSVVSKNQKEYLYYVNIIAQLLMGESFGYNYNHEFADVVAFKADAKQIYKDSTQKGTQKNTTLKPLKKNKLRIIKGGKDDIDQK